jgi:hypothetical protein
MHAAASRKYATGTGGSGRSGAREIRGSAGGRFSGHHRRPRDTRRSRGALGPRDPAGAAPRRGAPVALEDAGMVRLRRMPALLTPEIDEPWIDDHAVNAHDAPRTSPASSASSSERRPASAEQLPHAATRPSTSCSQRSTRTSVSPHAAQHAPSGNSVPRERRTPHRAHCLRLPLGRPHAQVRSSGIVRRMEGANISMLRFTCKFHGQRFTLSTATMICPTSRRAHARQIGSGRPRARSPLHEMCTPGPSLHALHRPSTLAFIDAR